MMLMLVLLYVHGRTWYNASETTERTPSKPVWWAHPSLRILFPSTWLLASCIAIIPQGAGAISSIIVCLLGIAFGAYIGVGSLAAFHRYRSPINRPDNANNYWIIGYALINLFVAPALAAISALAVPMLCRELLDLSLRLQAVGGTTLVILAAAMVAPPADDNGIRPAFPTSFFNPRFRNSPHARAAGAYVGFRAAALYAATACVAGAPGILIGLILAGGPCKIPNMVETVKLLDFSKANDSFAFGAAEALRLGAINAVLVVIAVCVFRIRAETWRFCQPDRHPVADSRSD